jgi:hypothetical protein
MRHHYSSEVHVGQAEDAEFDVVVAEEVTSAASSSRMARPRLDDWLDDRGDEANALWTSICGDLRVSPKELTARALNLKYF